MAGWMWAGGELRTHAVCLGLQRGEDPLYLGGPPRKHLSLGVETLQDQVVKVLSSQLLQGLCVQLVPGGDGPSVIQLIHLGGKTQGPG